MTERQRERVIHRVTERKSETERKNETEREKER